MARRDEERKSSFITRPDDAVSISKALEVIKYMSVEKGRAVMLWGPPGIGKTKAIQKFFLSAPSDGGLGFDELRQIIVAWEDPTTGKGMPMVRSMKLNGGPEIEVTKWAVSDVWAVPHSKRVAYFFDELPNATPAVTSVFQKIMHEKVVGGINISGCPIVAAGNDMTHAAGANRITTSMANRFFHLNVWPDVDEFIEYAVSNNFHEWVTAYTRFQKKHPEPIYNDGGKTNGVYDPLIQFDPQHNDRAWQSPRTIEFSSDALHSGMPDEMKKVAIAGAAGRKYQSGLYNYASIFSKLPDIDRILEGEEVEIPTAPDVQYATISSMIGKLLVLSGGKSNAEMEDDGYKPPKGFVKSVENALKFALKLSEQENSAEFAVVLLKDTTCAADKRIMRACGFEDSPFKKSGGAFEKLIKKFDIAKLGRL